VGGIVIDDQLRPNEEQAIRRRQHPQPHAARGARATPIRLAARIVSRPAEKQKTMAAPFSL
jgi:hypothetical protein